MEVSSIRSTFRFQFLSFIVYNCHDCYVVVLFFLAQRILLIAGIFLNFIITGLIVTLYLINGFLPFGWSQPLMAVITDRIAIFGGILMVVGPTIHSLQQTKKMCKLE